MPDSAPSPRYDVIAIGNAIVDIIAPCDEATLDALKLNRGGMTLVDAAGADTLFAAMEGPTQASGGSAANTLAGLAQLDTRCAFIGQVANDQFGEVFAHDIRAAGIDFDTPMRATDGSGQRVRNARTAATSPDSAGVQSPVSRCTGRRPRTAALQ